MEMREYKHKESTIIIYKNLMSIEESLEKKKFKKKRRFVKKTTGGI